MVGVAAAGVSRRRGAPQALERAWDRAGPGPVGGKVQCGSAGVAGELPGDVQDAVAQPLGLADLVLAVEPELLGPDDDVVRDDRELEPRGVRVEGVEREVRGAGRLQRLDAVLDLGVLAVRTSSAAISASGWSVMKHWKRCPSRSVKLSCAPGWGRSRRQISRVPCRPAREVDLAGQLGSPTPLRGLAVPA